MTTEANAGVKDSLLEKAKPGPTKTLRRSLAEVLGWMTLAITALHLGYAWNPARPLTAIYMVALLQLARQERWRLAFYPGLVVGWVIGMLQLNFFYTIFSVAAAALWLVLAFWIGLFVVLARLVLRRFGPIWGWLAVPFLWTGLEYFRSELYYLRFAWVTPGFAFANPPWHFAISPLGVYGTGFLIVSLVCGAMICHGGTRRALALAGVVAGLTLLPKLSLPEGDQPASSRVKIAGIQMEFPTESEVLTRLKDLLRKHPESELIVLSEYTFGDPVPQKVRDWCAANRRYLIAGGKEPGANGNFYNTAYVINPEGEIEFQQVKAVPIQFFKDGLPAVTQKVWDSPWGKIGICICYDLSYTRVTDILVAQGAEALIVPTMDVMDWGRAQHELHARVAPVRAAEYRLPIFRVASSGISQLVNRRGRTMAIAPSPGEGAFITGEMEFRGPGRRPVDRWLAPASVLITAALVLLFAWRFVYERLKGR